MSSGGVIRWLAQQFGPFCAPLLYLSAERSDMVKLVVYEGSPRSSGGSTGVTAALVSGLSFDDPAEQRRALKELLTQVQAVVLDVADLRVEHGPAVHLFSTVLLAAGEWPSVRLVLLRPDGRLTAALRTTGVVRDVHVAENIDCALITLRTRPPRVSRRRWLQPNVAARRQSRAMVNAVCHDWRVPYLAAGARTVVTELVDAVRRARTPAVLKITLDDAGLRSAVRDFRSIEGAELESDTPAGPTLQRVSRISDSCGVTPLSDGKIVWAVLKNRAAR